MEKLGKRTQVCGMSLFVPRLLLRKAHFQFEDKKLGLVTDIMGAVSYGMVRSTPHPNHLRNKTLVSQIRAPALKGSNLRCISLLSSLSNGCRHFYNARTCNFWL